MRIADDKGNQLDYVYLALSEDEAKELSDALADLLIAKPGWHAHFSDRPFEREDRLPRGRLDSLNVT